MRRLTYGSATGGGIICGPACIFEKPPSTRMLIGMVSSIDPPEKRNEPEGQKKPSLRTVQECRCIASDKAVATSQVRSRYIATCHRCAVAAASTWPPMPRQARADTPACCPKMRRFEYILSSNLRVDHTKYFRSHCSFWSWAAQCRHSGRGPGVCPQGRARVCRGPRLAPLVQPASPSRWAPSARVFLLVLS